MTRAEIRTFIAQGVNAINPALDYGSGRISEFNSNRNNSYPKVFFESINPVGTEFTYFVYPYDGWPIVLHIGKKDSADSLPEQYEVLIDECDYIAQQLLYQYNQSLEDSQGISIQGISREPFVKKHADIITGVILSFTLSSPDKTTLC